MSDPQHCEGGPTCYNELMAIPDSSGELHAVYHNPPAAHGSPLNIIDPATGTPGGGQVEVTWSQTGPQGPIGPQGPQGATGPQGAAGPPAPVGPVWSNTNTGNLNMDLVDALMISSPGSGLYDGQGASYYLWGVHKNAADAQSQLDDFVAGVGYPWVTIGRVANITNTGVYWVCAVNMRNVVRMTDSAGVGVQFATNARTAVSAGYEPYTDGPSAIAALMAMGVSGPDFTP